MLNEAHFRGDMDCIFASFVCPIVKKTRVMVVRWLKTSHAYFKLNTDGSVFQGMAGGLLRDSTDVLIFAFDKEVGEVNVLTAESLSLLHDLTLCLEKGFSNLHAEMDSIALAHLVTSNALAKWPLCITFRQIRLALISLAANLNHVFCENNGSADSLAVLHLNSDHILSFSAGSSDISESSSHFR